MDQMLGEIAVPEVLPRLSETPGQIRSLGPTFGDWNERVKALIEDESEIRPGLGG
jgi:hypothetical protein